jgi:ABC-type Fe3+ transport system substrate-binding protein
MTAVCRWGAMLVAFKREQLQRHNRTPIRCWADLLQPALKGRIAFPDNPREFVGIAFKTLNHPAIGTDLERIGFRRILYCR